MALLKKKMYISLMRPIGHFRIRKMGTHQLTMKGQSDFPTKHTSKNMVRVISTEKQP